MKTLRELQVYLNFFNLVFAYVIWSFKVTCLVVTILAGFAAIRLMDTNPVLGGLYAYACLLCIVLYVGMFQFAYKVTEKFEDLKRELEMTSAGLVNSEERKYSCPICGYKGKVRSALRSHMIIHGNEKQFECTLCPFRAKQQPNIRQHMNSVHSDERPFKCPQCEFAAKRKSNLIRHLRIHGEEKSHVCPHPNCEYKSHQAGNLKNHIKTHSSEKPIKCSLCDFSCKYNVALNVHMRTHTGETPYSCLICEYKAKAKSHLISHMRVHSGIKPYKCSKCDYAATKSSNLKSHQKIHTPSSSSRRHAQKIYCQVRDCGFLTEDNNKLAAHMTTHHNLPRVSIRPL